MIAIDDERVHNYSAECGKHLAIMEESLLSLELGGTGLDEALVTRLLGAAHAVQTGAGLCGLTAVAELAQRTERALAQIRLDRRAPTPERVTVLLRAIDMLRVLIGDPGASDEVDISAIMDALASLAKGGGASSAPRRGADWRLRALLAEDDFTSRLLLQTFLSRYGDCHIAVNGREAVEAFGAALERGQPYNLICMDIMMPELDGREAVRQIRAMEEARGIISTDGARIIMTTAVNEIKEVANCFHDLCDAYLVKPIDLSRLLAHMKSYDLIG
jgi:two-component system chemotaxis response regulator CheY